MASPAAAHPLDALGDLLGGRRVVALTGAGCSTESGIPDYRGDSRTRPAPLQYRDFVASEAVRRRYWARAVAGWPRIASARPNPAHHALAELERRGVVAGVITQNVDRLHAAAGSRRVVELHGALALVRCLACGDLSDRTELQDRLLAANPGWLARASEIAPDGDADVGGAADFALEGCRACAGPLKPDVVFFGENVPGPVVADAWDLFDEADVLLVVGSSLAVFSGYRFVRRAAECGIPIAIVNRGPTRGDSEAILRVDARAGEILPALLERLAG